MADRRIRLWDLPVRLTHWSFVALMPALWWTWKSENMFWHVRLGYIALGLVIFRVLWGVVGSSPARFTGFVKGPFAVSRYLRTLFSKSAEPIVGHNPMGGWSVVALLGALAGETGLGLFTSDTDGLNAGPLNYKVSDTLGETLTHWHGALFYALLALIAVHLLAITFYLVVKRENLIGPMITGARRLPESIAAPRLAPVWRLAVCFLIAMGLMWWASAGLPLRFPHAHP